MSRVEKFETVTEADAAVELDEDERFLQMWVKAGYFAQNFTILGFLATGVAILVYHL